MKSPLITKATTRNKNETRIYTVNNFIKSCMKSKKLKYFFFECFHARSYNHKSNRLQHKQSRFNAYPD